MWVKSEGLGIVAEVFISFRLSLNWSTIWWSNFVHTVFKKFVSWCMLQKKKPMHGFKMLLHKINTFYFFYKFLRSYLYIKIAIQKSWLSLGSHDYSENTKTLGLCLICQRNQSSFLLRINFVGTEYWKYKQNISNLKNPKYSKAWNSLSVTWHKWTVPHLTSCDRS